MKAHWAAGDTCKLIKIEQKAASSIPETETILRVEIIKSVRVTSEDK